MQKLIALLTVIAPSTYSKGPCQEASDWLREMSDLQTLDPRVDAEQAWDSCPRADWIEWLARRLTKHGTSRTYPQAIADGVPAVKKDFPFERAMELVDGACAEQAEKLALSDAGALTAAIERSL